MRKNLFADVVNRPFPTPTTKKAKVAKKVAAKKAKMGKKKKAKMGGAGMGKMGGGE